MPTADRENSPVLDYFAGAASPESGITWTKKAGQ